MGMYFTFDFTVGILSIVILSVKSRGSGGGGGGGGGGGLLNGQNPLSVIKVICRQSLKTVGARVLWFIAEHILCKC